MTVRSAIGLTKDFKVGVELHQGSALNPFLFAIIIDRLTEDIRNDAPWDMLFAAVCRHSPVKKKSYGARGRPGDLEKCTGKKMPESEPEQDQILRVGVLMMEKS